MSCADLFIALYGHIDDIPVFGYFAFVKYFNKTEENTKKTSIPER